MYAREYGGLIFDILIVFFQGNMNKELRMKYISS